LPVRQFPLRLSAELRAAVTEAAAAEGQSLQRWVADAIIERLKRDARKSKSLELTIRRLARLK
jgi:hypothetical protein